jgi:hypothetical protein
MYRIFMPVSIEVLPPSMNRFVKVMVSMPISIQQYFTEIGLQS